jgi:hypothetical protein
MMAWAALFKPRTRRWAKASQAISEYVQEQDKHHRKALGLERRT